MAIPAALDAEFFTFSPPSSLEYPRALKVAAKRYTSRASRANERGLTLVLMHCIGGQKEQWEATLGYVFTIQDRKSECQRIREAWALDWQSHGDSALLNAAALDESDECVSASERAIALSWFLRSNHVRGHRLVGLGHSAGSAAIVLSTKPFLQSTIPYEVIILIEPTTVTKKTDALRLEERQARVARMVSLTSKRRNVWPSRAAARTYFEKRAPWNIWDPRVVDAFVNLLLDFNFQEHGLVEDDLNRTPGTVRLKTDKKQEAASYADIESHHDAASLLSTLSHLVPTHLIWAEIEDVVPGFIRNSLSDAKEGRCIQSVATIPGADHMVVQQRPDALGCEIARILDTVSPCLTSGRVNGTRRVGTLVRSKL